MLSYFVFLINSNIKNSPKVISLLIIYNFLKKFNIFKIVLLPSIKEVH